MPICGSLTDTTLSQLSKRRYHSGAEKHRKTELSCYTVIATFILEA